MNMTQSAADIAREFLSIVWEGEAPDDAILVRALDRLLSKSHDIPDGSCSEADDEPPSIDQPALYQAAETRFPSFGLYPSADPLGTIDDAVSLGDAIDDIADLTTDLREVIWRDANLGPDDAAWYFRLMFFHWGRHARELAVYLHARQSG